MFNKTNQQKNHINPSSDIYNNAKDLLDEKNNRYLLVELLTTRLCHELTGPISAVNNGVEFLEENDGNINKEDPAIGLISSSSKQAIARLQLYRIAFGLVKNDGEQNIEEIERLIYDFFDGTKVKPIFSWQNSNQIISRKFARVLLNLAVIIADSLIKGGELHINYDHERRKCMIIANGDKIHFEDAMKIAIENNIVNEDELGARNVHGYFIAKIMQQYNFDFQYEISDEEFKAYICC